MNEPHDAEPEPLHSRLDAIEKRLGALEAAARVAAPGLSHAWPPLPGSAGPTRLSATHTVTAAGEAREGEAEILLEPAASPHRDAESAKSALFAAYAAHRAPVPVVAIDADPAAAAQMSAGGATRSLESRIGQNWASIIGALAVVLAALFFLKYAWDEGWLELSPGARIVAALMGGVSLLGAGQWVHRKRMRILAATLSGAGVAVMMAAFFAANGLFDPPVIASSTAFGGVAVAAALGIFVSLQIDSLAVTLVALIGAYIAPVVLGSHQDNSLGLMGYLAVLAVVGWVLSFLRLRWASLRWFVWSCSSIWIALWLMRFGLESDHLALGLAAVGFFFGGSLLEGLASAARARRGLAQWAGLDHAPVVPAEVTSIDEAIAALSMLNTAAAFAGYFVLLDPHAAPRAGLLSVHPAAGIAVLLAGIHAIIAWLTRGSRISQSSMIQAAALFTIVIPLSLGRLAITLAWLVLATAMAALAALTGNRPIRIWALVLLGLGLVRLVMFDAMDAALTTTWFTVADQPVSQWLILAWGMAGMFHAVAWLLVMPIDKVAVLPAPRIVTLWIAGAVTAAAGSGIFLISSALYWNGLPLTLLTIAWAMPILALHPFGARLALPGHAAVLVMIIAIKWLVADNLAGLLGQSPEARLAPLFNLSALAGVLLAFLLGTIRWIDRRQQNAAARSAAAAASLGIVFALLNFETLRAIDALRASFADPATARQVALSILWAMVGLAAVIIGFARNVAPLRYAALALLGITLAKVLLLDLAGVKPVYRVLSFLAVGIMLLCVSFVYHRQAQRDSSLTLKMNDEAQGELAE